MNEHKTKGKLDFHGPCVTPNTAMNIKLIWLILVLEYVFICGFLMNYDNAWVHAEKTMSHWALLDNGYSLKFEDFERGFDYRLPELGLPRITRPLSHMFDLLNAKFRASLWQYIPPHPSLSLMCLFSLTLLPFMLFRFLRNMGCRADVALAGVCLYLSTPGFLAQIPMMYQPGKSFVNIFAVACLWQASRLVRDNSAGAEQANRSFWWNYIALVTLVFVSFFWDETGLFIYAIIALVIFPLLRAKRSARYPMAAVYACLPVLYWLTVKIFLPNLHQYLGHGKPNVSEFIATPSFTDLIMPNLQNLFTNAVYLFNDHLHFYVNSILTTNSTSLRVLFVINDITVALFIAVLIYTVTQYFRHRIKNQPSPNLWYNMAVFFSLCVLYIWFHTWLLSKAAGGTGVRWGCWYYGAPFSLLFAICLTCALAIMLACYRSRAAGMAGIAFLSITIVCSLVFATYRNSYFRIWNQAHIIQPYESFFSGRMYNIFNYYNFRDSFAWHKIRYRYSRNVWDVVNGRTRRFADQDVELAKPQAFTLGLLRPVFHGAFDNVLNESQCYVLGATKGMLNAEILHTTRNPINFILIPDQLYFADVNGDKMADALYWDTSINDRGYFFVGLSRGGTAFDKLTLSLAYPVEAKTLTGGQRMNYADVNGDGKADVLYYETVSQHLVFASLATGSGFTQPVPCLKYSPMPTPPEFNPRHLQFADVNGDQLADAIYFDTRKDNGIRVSLFIKGQGITQPALWAQYNKSLPEQLQLADVNGDGKADAIYFDIKNDGLWVSLSTGTNFAEPTLWAQYAPTLFSKPTPGNILAPFFREEIQYADVNGDGKADALYFSHGVASGEERVSRNGSQANSPESGKGVWVRLSTGTRFAEPVCWLAFDQIAPHVMRYADVNGDRKSDALFTDPVIYQIMVCLSTGAGFSKPVLTKTVVQR